MKYKITPKRQSIARFEINENKTAYQQRSPLRLTSNYADLTNSRQRVSLWGTAHSYLFLRIDSHTFYL